MQQGLCNTCPHLICENEMSVQTMGIFCAATAFEDMLGASADSALADGIQSGASSASGLGSSGLAAPSAAEGDMISALHAMRLGPASQRYALAAVLLPFRHAKAQSRYA